MKKSIGISSSIVILIVSFLIPEAGGLSSDAIRTIGLTVAFLLLLITEAFPLSITCWTALGLMPLIGVSPSFGSALSGFSNPVLFFILGSFGISAAFTVLPLSKRILIVLMKKFGKSTKTMLFALMLCIVLISSFVSGVPTCAVFTAIGLSFLELFEDDAAKRTTGKAFMIAIPVASMIGGMATPVGNSINLLAIDLLREYTGTTISFVHWMALGIPIVILTMPVAWILMCKIYKPAEINPDVVKSFISGLDVPPKMSLQEKKALIVTAVMFVLWILSSWISQINIVVVTLLGTCVMFFPGIKVLEWKPFIKSVNLDSFFLVGTVLSIGKAMENNGVSEWISTLFPTGQMPLPVLALFIVTLVFVLFIIMPVGPSVVMFLAAPLIALSGSMGYSPALIMLTLGMASGNCFLLPLDTIPLITYGTGYYSMLDMPKSTFFLQIYLIIIMPLLLWAVSSLLRIG